MVNTRLRPQAKSADKSKSSNSRFILTRDNADEIRLSRAGYVTIITQPDPPLPPKFLDPDVIHYDHLVPVSDLTAFGTIPAQIPLTKEEEVEKLIKDTEISVVDKLEKYKDMMLIKNPKNGNYFPLILLIIILVYYFHLNKVLTNVIYMKHVFL